MSSGSARAALSECPPRLGRGPRKAWCCTPPTAAPRGASRLDGRTIGELMLRHYQRRAKAGDAKAGDMLREAESFAAQGPDKPFLDVWFEDEKKGFVVGAFNLILRTEDGGQSWTPWLDRVDNPKAYHLYAIRPAGGHCSSSSASKASCSSSTARRSASRALRCPTRARCSACSGTPSSTLVFGLRGNAFQQHSTAARAGRSSTPA